MWLTHDGCKTLIQNAWSFYSQGSRAFQLQQKLKNVRKELCSWNKKVFGKVDKEKREKQKTLQDLQDSIKTVQDIRVGKELREDIENLMKIRLCLVHVKYFPEMLILGKENIFKCLVAFQKMLWKIFSSVWLFC